MMNNSLRECYYNSDTIVSSVKMLLQSPKCSKKILVIVEGIDDKKLFDSLFNEHKAYVYNVGGCGLFGRILEELYSAYSSRFIVIKDSDFDVLDGIKYEYLNLFHTDGHDQEMMEMTDRFAKKINLEFCNDSKLDVMEVEKEIENVSYIKWYNERKNLNLRVDRFKPYQGFYNGRDKISISDAIKKLYDLDDNAEKMDICERDIEIFIESNKTDDYSNLTNGHDMCEAISRKMHYLKEKDNGIKPLNAENIPHFLRVSYSLEEFKETQLFNELKKWGMREKVELF